MAEQEKKSSGSSPVVIVEQSAHRSHMQAFRPSDHQEDPDLQHKRSKASAPLAVTDEINDTMDIKDNKKFQRSVSLEKRASKKVSTTKKRSSSPENIKMSTMQVDNKKSGLVSSQPIPAQVSKHVEKTTVDTNIVDVDESITQEDVQSRTQSPETSSKFTKEEEEGVGLPRSESRASRMSRASRTLRSWLCCGVRVEAPSEYDIPSHRFHAI